MNKNTDSDVRIINVIDKGEDGLGAINEDKVCSDEEEIVDSKTGMLAFLYHKRKLIKA